MNHPLKSSTLPIETLTRLPREITTILTIQLTMSPKSMGQGESGKNNKKTLKNNKKSSRWLSLLISTLMI
jgi:hypothetical protein